MPYVVHKFNGERRVYDTIEGASREVLNELVSCYEVFADDEVSDAAYNEYLADTSEALLRLRPNEAASVTFAFHANGVTLKYTSLVGRVEEHEE